MSKDKPQISNFNGYFQFLNNDFPTWVSFDNQLYPSVTTAFQASRCSDLKTRRQIQQAQDFQTLKSIVLTIKNPQNWSEARYKIMESLVRDKFRRNKEIREKLRQTQDRELINTYELEGDNELYWGVCKSKGMNCLGKILMLIRQEIKKGTDLERWLIDNNLQKNSLLWSKVVITCKKQGSIVDKLLLQNKPLHTFGSLDLNSFKLQHPSISKQHAVIFFTKDIKVYFVDLESSAGTMINQTKIDPFKLYQLKTNDEIVFGMSTRKYYANIDSAMAENYLQKRAKQIKSQMKDIEGLEGNLSNREIRNKLGYKIEDCIIVEGIPFSTSYRELKELFQQWMKVKSINMLVDNRTGRPVGIALIYAKHEKQAQELVKRSKPLKIKGQPLSMRLLDTLEADKILIQYRIDQQKVKKERSRSRSRDKKHRQKEQESQRKRQRY